MVMTTLTWRRKFLLFLITISVFFCTFRMYRKRREGTHPRCEGKDAAQFGVDLRFTIPPPLEIRYGSRFDIWDRAMIAPENRLMLCPILKNANTEFLALFVRRYAPKFLSTNIRTAAQFNALWGRAGYGNGKHPGVHYYNHTFMQNIWNNESKWQRWVFVRDPYERFLSGFLDINDRVPTGHYQGCAKDDLSCFLSENYKWMYGFSNAKPKKDMYKTTFVHYAPQSWQCGLHKMFNKEYTRIFEVSSSPSFGVSVVEALLKLGWPRHQIQTGWGKDSKQPFLGRPDSVHSTTGEFARKHSKGLTKESVTARMAADRTLSELFLKTYWIDYRLLQQYRPPEFIRKQCADCGIECKEWAICLIWNTMCHRDCESTRDYV